MKYKDLTNNNFDGKTLKIKHYLLTSLEGIPEIIKGEVICSYNNLTSLEYSPKIVEGDYNCRNNKLKTLKSGKIIIKGCFNCLDNPDLKNIKEQIIENQILAEAYRTDKGNFLYEEIKEKFEEYGDFLLKKEKLIKENKKIINNKDYGLSI